MNVQLTDKKEAIFQSALNIIHEHGFHGAPMSQIAKQANVSVGSIYHYFESKDELILALFVHCKTKLTRYLFDGLGEHIPYSDRFKTVWKRFIKFYTAHPTIFRFMEQFYSSPFHEMERLKKEKNPSDIEDIYHFLQQGLAKKKLKGLDIQLLCSAYTGVAVSFAKAMIYGKAVFDDQQTEDMVELVWNSIKAERV